MNILIIGSTGMLGNTLKKYMISKNHNVSSLNRSDIDLSKCSYDQYESILIDKLKNVELVVNCAGLIPQRKGTDTADMIKMNSILPRWTESITLDKGINFIHITTDCVFKADETQYDENHIHDAKDHYGLSKSLGEPESTTVIRTSIIGEEDNNKLSLLEWVRSNRDKDINGYTTHIWNGMTCLQLSKIIEEISIKNLYWKGVRHLHSDTVNKYELSNMINDVYDLNINITPIDVDIVDRSLSSIYDIEFDIPNIIDQIKEMKEFHG